MAIIDKIQLSGTVYTIGNETTTAVTSASTDNEIPTAKAVYDAIPQGGGGKSIEAGTNISITTGETTDTINCTLPISVGTGDYLLLYNDNSNNIESSNKRGFIFGSLNGCYNPIDSNSPFIIGDWNEATANMPFIFGHSCKAKGLRNFLGGYKLNGNYSEETAFGHWNNSFTGSTDADKTLFSVGNGTSESARHNAFEIRHNGDIYITKDGQDVKLQDQLGGGGTSYTAGDGIDINNDVISVTGKVDTSAFTAHTADTVIHVTSAEKAAWNDKQDALVSGKNIKTINGETLLGEGNIDIQGGGVNVVQTTGTSTTDVMSQDAVTNAFRKTNLVSTSYSSGHLDLECKDPFNTSYRTMLKFGMINGKTVANITTTRPSFSLVETSAITTSVTSSSTDTQVPSAKAVYDQLGGLKLVKLTQSEYDSLTTKDNSTLYVIVN